MKRVKFLVELSLLAVLIGVGIGILTHRQAVADWFKLRGYSAPAEIEQLATADTMTPKAQHLFYVNKPSILGGKPFTAKCSGTSEKTVILGCYVGNDGGIFLYDVTDERLDGVEQVTAAHEMLHAAYRRLPADERDRVDSLLQDYYRTVTDQRIKDVIAAYQLSEPNDVVNEMHSIFATEIIDLPPALETYYRQYFMNRSSVTAFTARYEAEFTSRQALISQYDTQLQILKQQIDTNQANLRAQQANIESQDRSMQTALQNGNRQQYNSQVSSYNAAINSYNALVTTTKQLINQYNDLVSKRNAVALEEQQLQQALSADELTAK